VAEHLMSDAMFSGWGIRTLASTMGAYNPMSYHNGSVWPHDNAIIAAGLARQGFRSEAVRVADALLDASESFGWRLPELFCGFGREEFAAPVPYPTSCSPQAWAAAAPVELLRTMLGLDPDGARTGVTLEPHLASSMTPLDVLGVRVGEAALAVHVDGDQTQVAPLLDVLHGAAGQSDGR
jgi:glycogen debranching enzyme